MDNTPAAIIRRLFKPDNNRKIIQEKFDAGIDRDKALELLETTPRWRRWFLGKRKTGDELTPEQVLKLAKFPDTDVAAEIFKERNLFGGSDFQTALTNHAFMLLQFAANTEKGKFVRDHLWGAKKIPARIKTKEALYKKLTAKDIITLLGILKTETPIEINRSLISEITETSKIWNKLNAAKKLEALHIIRKINESLLPYGTQQQQIDNTQLIIKNPKLLGSRNEFNTGAVAEIQLCLKKEKNFVEIHNPTPWRKFWGQADRDLVTLIQHGIIDSALYSDHIEKAVDKIKKYVPYTEHKERIPFGNHKNTIEGKFELKDFDDCTAKELMFLIAVKKISKDQLESIIINLFTPSHNPPKNFKTRQEKFIQLLKIAGDAASKSVTQRTQHLATTLISALDGAATTQRSLVVTLNQSIYARTGIEELTKLESPSECERLQAVLLPAPIQAKPVHATPGTPPEEEDPDDFEEVTPAQLQPAKEPQEQRESVVDEFAARKLPRLNSSGLVELISNTVERTLPKKAPAPLSHKSSYAPQTGEYFNIERTIQEQTYIFMHPASDKATISPTNKNMGAQPLARALEDAKKLTTGKENVTVFIPVTQTPRAHWTLLKLQMSNGKVTHADWHDPKRRILWSTDNADTLAILRKTFPKISITEKYHTDKQSIRDTTQCGYYVTDIITNEINDQLRQRPSNKETVPPEPAPDDDGAGARYLPEHLPPETREAKRLPTDGAAAQQPRAVVPGDEASADALSQAGLFGQQHEEAEVAKERSAGKDNEQIVPPTEGF